MRTLIWTVVLLTGCSGDLATDTISSSKGNTANGTNIPGNTGTNTGTADPFGMVATHNQIRSSAQPVPTPALPPMVWDPALAQVAQAWAEGCDFTHSTDSYGENLYVSSSQNGGVSATMSWADEAIDFNYQTNGCTPGEMCGHYTQIVWRDSTRVGCGYADCTNLLNVGSFNSGRLWVCNYDPPGNWVGERPY
jgi:uncharacterized protein YkwD